MIVSPIRVTDAHLERAGGQSGAGGGRRPAARRRAGRQRAHRLAYRRRAGRRPSRSPPAGGGSASSTARSTPSRAPPATPASAPPWPRTASRTTRACRGRRLPVRGRPGRHRAAARREPTRTRCSAPTTSSRSARCTRCWPPDRRVPQDVALVGMDDTELAADGVPPALQCLARLGRRVAAAPPNSCSNASPTPTCRRAAGRSLVVARPALAVPALDRNGSAGDDRSPR